jgi:hypothetical protein
MPSPLPGMDPYIEHPEIWSDFHGDLAAELRARLNAVIRPRYVARLAPRVTYEEIEIATPRGVRPDVGVWKPESSNGSIPRVAGATPESAGTITQASAESLVPLDVPLRLYGVEIRETATLALVTAIEILSPVNKRKGHEAHRGYLRKRRELFRSSAHLLEIDLLRGGDRPPLERPVPPAPYYVVLSRAERRPKVEVWPIQLRDPLPTLPVPLLEPDPDVPLDLAEVVAAVYERGAYADLIDYSGKPPLPPLDPTESEWLERVLEETRRK